MEAALSDRDDILRKYSRWITTIVFSDEFQSLCAELRQHYETGSNSGSTARIAFQDALYTMMLEDELRDPLY